MVGLVDLFLHDLTRAEYKFLNRPAHLLVNPTYTSLFGYMPSVKTLRLQTRPSADHMTAKRGSHSCYVNLTPDLMFSLTNGHIAYNCKHQARALLMLAHMFH